MSVTCPSKTTTSWKSTSSINKKKSPCLPTSTSSWPLSPPVGNVIVSMKPSTSWVNACCTTTPTRSFTSRNRDNPTLPWEITSDSLPVNWMPTITSKNSCREVPRVTGCKTKNGKVECKVRGFRLNSEGKTQFNYHVMRQNVLDEIQHPQKEPRQSQVVKIIIRSSETPKPTISTPFPTTSVTKWCTTRESSIPVPSKTYTYGYQEAV